MTTPAMLTIPSMKARCSRGRVAGARRPRGLLPAGRPLRHDRHDGQPHLVARAGRAGRLPDQRLRDDVRGDHRLEPDQGRPAGEILSKPDFGALDYGINKAGYVIHSAVHAARPEVACVIHTHSWASMAVSSLECGLLPLTQTAMRFLKIGYHDYQGVVLDDARAGLAARRPRRGRGADPAQPRRAGRRPHASARPSTGRIGSSSPAARRSRAMACNTPLRDVPQPTCSRRPGTTTSRGTRRPYGLMEWPALLRKLDRLDPSYRD